MDQYSHMKKVAGTTLILISILTLSCSKKNDVQPQPHTIKITASGSDTFTATLSTLKTTDSKPVVADPKTIEKGSVYTYTGSFNSGDLVSADIESDVANSITYTIEDNGAVVAQGDNKEIGTHETITIGYGLP
jgi:hypothetical protein